MGAGGSGPGLLILRAAVFPLLFLLSGALFLACLCFALILFCLALVALSLCFLINPGAVRRAMEILSGGAASLIGRAGELAGALSSLAGALAGSPEPPAREDTSAGEPPGRP